MNMSFTTPGKIRYVLREHFLKIIVVTLSIVMIIITTIWATHRFQKKESAQDRVRTAILECTTPGSPENPNQCFVQVQAQSAARGNQTIRRAIELLAVDNDCRLRRTLWGLPAPEARDDEGHLIPCPAQTPPHIYPGDGSIPPL